MLLPSDVARLVLGYLQQENLISTCQTFILESSNLKEYAEHCTDEGFIPACLLSLFGKNLTTILNEYVAMKAKETTNDVPAMMSSLWKKLDHTLSQIRSMQSSPGFAANQRARTRSGIAEIKRQRKFASQAVPISSELSSLPYQTGQYTSTPLAATQVIRPMSQNTTQFRTNSAFVSQPPDNIATTDSLHIVVPVPQERKIHSSLMSPGRRKSESQRKNITFSGPQSTVRNFQDPNAFTVEKQMVIENAREKILSNKSLQEKLAENINKFLISDSNIAQVPKQADSNPTEQEASIDEILGLQSEIHMSEEAIQDILEQTESDPAFQALFDLFDYGKTKNNKSISQGISSQHLEANQNVLVGETNLAVESTFGTEESNDRSGEPTFCTDFQTEDVSCALKDGSVDGDLKKQETQEQCAPMESTLQKETFKSPSCVAPEQSCNLEIAFESVPNLNDFNQRGNSGPECNEQCTELYTNQLSSENEMALEIEKDSSVSNTPNTSELHPDQSDLPLASFTSLDGVAENNENLTNHGKNSNHFLQNISLTGKSSQNSQPCESPSDSVKLKTIFHSSKSPDCSEIQQNKIETNDILPVVSHQPPDCQDDSSNQNKVLPGSVHSSDLNLSDHHKIEGSLEESVTSSKQSSCQSLVDSNRLENKGLPSEPSNSEEIALESQEPSSSVKEDGDAILLSPGKSVECREIEMIPTESDPTEYSHSVPSESLCSSVGEINTEPQSTGEYEHSRDSSAEVDPSNIVSLKIIISDDPFVSTDTELNNAVSSITGENLPTIIVSSPAKSPVKNVGLVKCLTSEETSNTVLSAEKVGDSTLVEQSLLVLKSKDCVTNNIQNDDCSAFSAAVTPTVSQDGGFIQLMPATSTTFGNSSNILIATCVTDPTTLGTAVTQSNVVVLPNNSSPMAAQPPPPQQLQTPPRSNSMFAVNQAVSPNFSQGSAIIIASPVQPVLQGMVGMIPVSVVGQNGSTFPAPPRQVLHMPLAAPVCNRSVPKLPIPPKSQKVQGTRNKPCTVPGKLTTSLGDSLNHPVGFHTQRTLMPEKNLTTDLGKKLEDTTIPLSTENTVSTSKPHESHRRVLCFDTPGISTQGSNTKTPSQNKERNEIPFVNVDTPTVSSSIVKSSFNVKKEREKPSAPKILSQSETASSRNTTIKETLPDKKTSLTGLVLDSFHKATANKENELQRDVERQKNQEAIKLSNGHQNSPLWNEKTAASVQELNKKQGPSSNSKNTVSTGTVSKELKREQTKSVSPLTKNSVEKLHDLHWHSPSNRLPSSGDLPVPRTPGSGTGEKHREEPCDSIQTPTSRRYNDESGTAKGMVPPATPDLPACSPASETGSENSVNMAAHTLMILSRAAISRTTSKPLKDNTQQFRSSRSATKKRKLEDLEERDRTARSANKNLPNSAVPVKKKKIKKKKLPNSFPAGMDVDKFLLSLHYDE